MSAVSAPLQHLHSVAIIAPPVEAQWLSDYVIAREMPLHIAAVIAIVALFAIAWTLLSDSPRKQRPTSIAGASQ